MSLLNSYLPDLSITKSDLVRNLSLHWCFCLFLTLFCQYLHFTFEAMSLGAYNFRIIFLGEFIHYLTIFMIPNNAFHLQLFDAHYWYSSQVLFFFASVLVLDSICLVSVFSDSLLLTFLGRYDLSISLEYRI